MIERNSTIDYCLSLLRSAVFEVRTDLPGLNFQYDHISQVCDIAAKQAVEGLVIKGIFDSGVKLDRPDLIDLVGTRQSIWQRNLELDQAVVNLCNVMSVTGVRIWVVKGQTMAVLYPEPKSRSCGDVDFLCHPDDWEKAKTVLCKNYNAHLTNTSSPKHIEVKSEGIQYEMHRTLLMLSHPRHQHYWDDVVIKDFLSSASHVEINGASVPILPPTINVAYIFAHLFGHFIDEGIGLRHFCDWALVLKHYKDEIDAIRLSEYLDGIGLRKAFIGFGAVLTDYLGLPEEIFPYEIPEKFHRRAPSLLKNIIKKGNFGKNKKYLKKSGPIHGLQHLWRIAGQAIRFGHYAPAESWWKIPRMFIWWCEKLRRMVGNR